MRRALVLCDDFAHHPFRASLPRHVCAPARAKAAAGASGDGKMRRFVRRLPRVSMQEWRDFWLAYCACFVCVMTFIA